MKNTQIIALSLSVFTLTADAMITRAPNGVITYIPLQENPQTRPFFQSIQIDFEKKVREHLDSGIDPNILNQHHRTPLEHAARHASFKSINLLLNHPKIDLKKGTPLIDAVLCNNISIVKRLLEAGLDPQKEDRLQNTPLSMAYYQGDKKEEITQLINQYISTKGVSSLN